MSELVLRFEHVVGRAALKLWPIFRAISRNSYSRMPWEATRDLRHLLAVYLHDHHPRTAHPPKPTALA